MSPTTDSILSSFAVRKGELKRFDVHYYLPKYRINHINLLNIFPNIKRLDNYSDVICGPFGSAITNADYLTEGVPLLRILNISKDGSIDMSNIVYISPDKARKLESTQVKTGDLVISQRGTLGLPAVVPSIYKKWNISANLIAIKNLRSLNPTYVQFFLSSSLGKAQLERFQSGQVQGKINTNDVASILIPEIQDQDELANEIEFLRNKNQKELEKATELLNSINSFVVAELGLTVPKHSMKKTFSVRMESIRQNKTMNPDYYHPERMESIKNIQNNTPRLQAKKLIEIADFIRDITLVKESDKYIGLASVQSNSGELLPANEEAAGQCFRFEKGDILFGRLRPYLNKVYCAQNRGVCSTEFHVIRLHKYENPDEKIYPEFIAAVLRSPLILAQTKHMMTGNTHPRLSNDDVVNLILPIPRKYNLQIKIVEEIKKKQNDAHNMRIKANQDWEIVKQSFERKLLEGSLH